MSEFTTAEVGIRSKLDKVQISQGQNCSYFFLIEKYGKLFFYPQTCLLSISFTLFIIHYLDQFLAFGKMRKQLQHIQEIE